MSPEAAKALLGPPPPTSDKKAYRNYRYLLWRYTNPERYREQLKANNEYRAARVYVPRSTPVDD